jgi:hypothetical protein
MHTLLVGLTVWRFENVARRCLAGGSSGSFAAKIPPSLQKRPS